jgi:hypothetical protein
MPVSQSLLPWLPALLIAALGAAALAATAVPAISNAAKQRRLAGLAILGVLALGTMVWQAWAAGREIARLKQDDRSTELAVQVKALEHQVAKLKESTRVRALDAEVATRLADFLRPNGPRTVVVSCIPNDIEAYEYATEIADALKSAKWDARGPETTMMFGKIRAMGVNIFDEGVPGSDTVKILVAAFGKFAIPYQIRVPPSAAPPSGAVELFVGTRPVQPEAAAVETER